MTEDCFWGRNNVDLLFRNTHGARQKLSMCITMCLRKVDAAGNSHDWTGSKYYIKITRREMLT